MPPLRDALHRKGVPFVDCPTTGGILDISASPPDSIYLNRMSPSSHTRGHQGGVDFAKELLWTLEQHGRRVINGSSAFALEVSKVKQHAALEAEGIATPKTLSVIGETADYLAAAAHLEPPFITKDNQGGKGLGVQLFRSHEGLGSYLKSDAFTLGPDGVLLLQEYIRPATPQITRVEIVDGTFQYAIHSSTEQGFELCPSDACRVDTQNCPVGDTGLFSLAAELTADDPLVQAYVRLCARHSIDIAGIEYVQDASGRRYTYDIKGTTNFNSGLEQQHGLSGMDAIAQLCARNLNEARSCGAVNSSELPPNAAWTLIRGTSTRVGEGPWPPRS